MSGKRKLLYVDDELDNLVVFEATFDEQFQIFTASSGEEALELLTRHVFPVVLADQRMTGMTGAELFEVMRLKHPQTKRVILTGYADSSAMLDAINQGQVYYFCKKPWERDMIFSVIVRAIEAYDMAVAHNALTDRLVAADRCATLGRSAAQVAHEMGNQLCLLPLLELIEDDYSDHADLVSLATVAREAYDRLVGLINEVKAFARFDQKEFSRQRINLSETLLELVDFLRYDNSLPIDRLRVDIRTDAVVLANKVKLQQVVVNLLKNAAHAIAQRSEGQITLSLAATGDSAQIQVVDNGCGMTAEVAERIWEPFFTTKGEEGNGLGLDIAKAVIDTHGGTIGCHSAPGQGATFTIRLPLIPTTTPLAVPLIANISMQPYPTATST